MEYGEYMRIHNGSLEGNPANIFKYLTIEGDKIGFRERRLRTEKLECLRASKTKTVL